jgi:hypothetical protein
MKSRAHDRVLWLQFVLNQTVAIYYKLAPEMYPRPTATTFSCISALSTARSAVSNLEICIFERKFIFQRVGSHHFPDPILLHNQIVHGKSTYDFLLEIYIPVKINMLCRNLKIIGLACWVGHGSLRSSQVQKRQVSITVTVAFIM